jgi:hypothetical protein
MHEAQHGGWGRVGRLSALGFATLTAVVAAAVLPPWIRVFVSLRFYHQTVVGFLACLKYAYLVALSASLAGSVICGYMLCRARSARHTAAVGLVLSVSWLVATALAESLAAAALAWQGWQQSRSMEASGLAEDFTLPLSFPGAGDPSEVNLFVLGESSAEGYPCQEWLSIGRLVTWQLSRSIPDKRFRLELLAHAGDTLQAQHRKLASISTRPDAVVVYCGHNEFAARYSAERRVTYYRDVVSSERPSCGLAVALRVSPLCSLIEKVADAHRVGIPPPVQTSWPLIDSPVHSQEEYAERLADFRRRLERIVAYCRQIGAVPILVIPPSNDAGFEPNRSFLARTTPRAEREAIRDEFLAIRSREDANLSASIEAYRALLLRQPGFAEAHFRLGRLLERAGQWGDAYRHYIAGRDCDGLPIRCPSAFQDAYRQVGQAYDAILVDGQSLFHQIGLHGLLNDHLFHDAMHPSVRGHIALAEAILSGLHARRCFGWPAASPPPAIDAAECVRHFGIDTAAWKTLCERGAMFYYGFGSSRYDVRERRAKQEAFLEAARRIAGGEPAESIGLPSIGIAATSPGPASCLPTRPGLPGRLRTTPRPAWVGRANQTCETFLE